MSRDRKLSLKTAGDGYPRRQREKLSRDRTKHVNKIQTLSNTNVQEVDRAKC